MKKIKRIAWDLVLAFVYGCVGAFCIIGCCAQAHAEEPQKHDTMLVVKKAEKGAKTKTIYTIKVDNKVYRIYKGPRGGYFYEINGKRRYLTDKQKQALGLS